MIIAKRKLGEEARAIYSIQYTTILPIGKSPEGDNALTQDAKQFRGYFSYQALRSMQTEAASEYFRF